MKNKSKKISAGILLFLSLSLLLISRETLLNHINYLLQSPCDRTLTYRIDSVDPQFNLSEKEFLEKVDQGAEIWNDLEGKTLFTYHEDGEISVNLLYDERQDLRIQIKDLQDQLESGKSNYEQNKTLYDQLVAEFEPRLAKFNNDVTYWNSQGGAPSNIYYELKQEQNELQSLADKINKLADQLNLTVTNYNLQSSNLEETTDNYNEELQNKPEEGIYIPNENRIEIYFSVNPNELVHTIAHEFGHALQLDHVENNSNAIMYPYVSQTLTPSVEDKQMLTNLCEQKTYQIILKDWGNRFENNLEKIYNLLRDAYQRLT